MSVQKLIYAGFATAALASVSVPALAWTVWPDIDFQWYADVGKPAAYTDVDVGMASVRTPYEYPQVATVEVTPAHRDGYIWSPGHWENRRGDRTAWVQGHYVKDDYRQQVYAYNQGNTTVYATGPTVLYDRQGNVIPTSPDAYPVDSARR